MDDPHDGGSALPVKGTNGMTAGHDTEPQSQAIIDRAAIFDHFEGDIELLREIAGLFLEDCPNRLSALRAAIARGDCKALESAAHSLKGSVVNFGARAAAVAAQRVEQMARDGDMEHAREACPMLEEEIARLEPVLAHLGDGDAW